jgi:hypothetical protein
MGTESDRRASAGDPSRMPRKSPFRMKRSRPGAARLEAIARKETRSELRSFSSPIERWATRSSGTTDTLRRIVSKGARAIRSGRGRVLRRSLETGHKTAFFPSLLVPLQARAGELSGARTCLVPSPDRGDPSSRDGARSGCRDPRSNFGALAQLPWHVETAQRDLSLRCEFCRKAWPHLALQSTPVLSTPSDLPRSPANRGPHRIRHRRSEYEYSS